MENPRSGFGIEVLDGKIVAVGGYNDNSAMFNFEQYDIETDQWATVRSPRASTFGLGCCVIKDIKIIKKVLGPWPTSVYDSLE